MSEISNEERDLETEDATEIEPGTSIELSDELQETMSGVSYLRVGSLTRAVTLDIRDITDAIAKNPLFDASRYDGVDPYGWTVQASNTDLDSYYTHMLPTSLKNYVADAQGFGVPFQHAHDPHSMPIGRSLGGQYMGSQKPRAMMDFYSFPGLRSKDITSDEFMNGVWAGVYRDVSIGFYGGDYICDLCGRDLMTYDCMHFPGMKYPEADGEGKNSKGSKSKKMIVATAGVNDAHCAEVSTVYHGATPGAVIMKARGLAMSGELRPEVATLLESRYRVALPRTARVFQVKTNSIDVVESNEQVEEPNDTRVAAEDTQEVVNNSPEMEVTMPEDAKPDVQVEERVVERVVEKEVPAKPVRAMELVSESERTDLVAFGVAEDMDAARAINALMSHIRKLAPMADDGKAYREHLIEDGAKAAVRAFGADTDVERYKAILSQQSVDTIRLMTEDWNKTSSESLKGGRQTVDNDEGAPKPTTDGSTVRTPSRLYAV